MNEQSKSDPSSWEEWVNQLINLPKEKQLEALLVKVKEQHLQIQNYLSEKSELQSLVQELQSQIQKQSEQLVKQSESDQILEVINKKSEELKINKEWINRQTLINMTDRNAIDRDRKYLDELVNEEVSRAARRYKKRAEFVAVIVIAGIVLLYAVIGIIACCT